MVNYGLILLNVLLFFWQYLVGREGYYPFMLHTASPEMYQFISYAFLHDGIMHLLGNMLFLYIFGNSVNDKMGHLNYLLFYLGAAVFSGAGFAWFTQSMAPLLGASGAIAGVTTAYLVLFPRARVTVLLWFFLITTFEVSSLVLIALKLVLYDNIIEPQLSQGGSRVAYTAHLLGYLYGFVLPLVMLYFRVLARDQFDLLALLDRWNRRQTFARAMSDPYTQARAKYGRVARNPQQGEKSTVTLKPVKEDPQAKRIGELRARVGQMVGTGNLSGAARLYEQLRDMDADHVLPPGHQLQVGNQLMSEGQYPQAASAYETLIKHYPRHDHRDQVRLLLGIIYARYLDQPELARMNLEAAMAELRDEGQRRMCQQELDRLR